jgi:hypothetical protein
MNSSSNMIRERVSTQGIVRELEPEEQLSAFSISPEQVGTLPQAAIARYMTAREKMERRYKRVRARINEARERAASDASHHAFAQMTRLQHYLDRQPNEGTISEAMRANLLGASWGLAWALDSDEHPPPSSIVARRDTKEALALAHIADQAIFADETSLNVNNLWGLVMNFFNASPRDAKRRQRERMVGRDKDKGKMRSSLGFWRIGKLGKMSETTKEEDKNKEETIYRNGKAAISRHQADTSTSANQGGE